MYNVGGIPHLEWNGDSSTIGGYPNGTWQGLYPIYAAIIDTFMTNQTPYAIGISGEYSGSQVNFDIELLLNDDRSPDNMYLELFVAEDSIYSYWGAIDEYHNARNVARRYITKSTSQKLPISISASGESETFSGSFEISEAWVDSNIKIISIVQDLDIFQVFQVATRNIMNMDPDLDGDGFDDVYDNCPNTYNPDQLDVDGDGIGDVCDPCNALAAVLGNVNLDASGDDYIPIIDVADILALSDLVNNTGLPPNDCQQIDLLEDGTINDWDLFVLVDLVMAGGN